MLKEKVYIVDDNDNIIGEKWRDDLTDSDCWRIVTIWVENDKGEVLIQQRSHDKRMEPGKWSPAAAGTVTLGDSYEKTAHKELVEELGITDVFPLKKTSKTHFKADIGTRFNQNFTCIIPLLIEAFIIQKEELADLQWVNREWLLKDLKQNSHLYIQEGNWEYNYGFY